jgi:hypothetical protein
MVMSEETPNYISMDMCMLVCVYIITVLDCIERVLFKVVYYYTQILTNYSWVQLIIFQAH